MSRSRTLRRRISLSCLGLPLALALSGLVATAREDSAASLSLRPRFTGLERLYFDRLEDPAAAVSSLRRAGDASPRDEVMRRLLPPALREGEGPAAEERMVDAGGDAYYSGLWVRDFPLPVAVAGADAFLRQVVDRTHPRIHEQFWALYADGRRTDFWFFSPTWDRTESKLLAPLIVEEVRPSEEGLLLRVSGAMIRPQGAGWLQGVDLVFATDGDELRYRYNVRRYSFTYGYDLGEGRSSLVTVETPFARAGRTVLVQRLAFDVPRDREIECGVDAEFAFPAGTFEELLEIATCITSSPQAATRERDTDEPTFIERGGKATPRPVAPRASGATFAPPPGAVELCSGHVTGAPLPNGRSGSHVSWTLYTSIDSCSLVAQGYRRALGDDGHASDSHCDSWKRPPRRPDRILQVCELGAEGPWSDCPPPPGEAGCRIVISTISRSQ